MAIWEEMKEYGVDQNTINYNSLLSKSKEPRRNGGTRMRMKPWAENKTLDSLDVDVESLSNLFLTRQWQDMSASYC